MRAKNCWILFEKVILFSNETLEIKRVRLGPDAERSSHQGGATKLSFNPEGEGGSFLHLLP